MCSCKRLISLTSNKRIPYLWIHYSWISNTFTPFYKTVYIIYDLYNTLFLKLGGISFFIDARVSVRVSVGFLMVSETCREASELAPEYQIQEKMKWG